jgi:histidyl-tRNA synthetase
MYHFEHGGRKIGMRFDLTIPLARFAAQHIAQLGTPFKRYHIAPVWRGENTQAGRYREFVQCDFDTIGTESVVADIETAIVIGELMSEIGVERYQLRMNNRQVLNGLLEKLGLRDQSVAVLRALDKLEKAGPVKVREELLQTDNISNSQVDEILALADIRGDTNSVLGQLADLLKGVELGLQGVDRLRAIAEALDSSGISSDFESMSRSHVDSITTPALFSRRPCKTYQASEAFVAEVDTTIWPVSIPSSTYRESGLHWDLIA